MHQLSEKANIPYPTVVKWFKDDDFLLELEKEQRRLFAVAAAHAQKRLIELCDSPNSSVALGACRDVLDRSGYKPIEKIENTNTVITVNVTDSEEDKD